MIKHFENKWLRELPLLILFLLFLTLCGAGCILLMGV